MWKKICLVGHLQLVFLFSRNLSLIVRLMRVATPELFAEVGTHVYAHTPYSLVYLSPAIRSMFKFMYVNTVMQVSVWKIPLFPFSSPNFPFAFTTIPQRPLANSLINRGNLQGADLFPGLVRELNIRLFSPNFLSILRQKDGKVPSLRQIIHTPSHIISLE